MKGGSELANSHQWTTNHGRGVRPGGILVRAVVAQTPAGSRYIVRHNRRHDGCGYGALTILPLVLARPTGHSGHWRDMSSWQRSHLIINHLRRTQQGDMKTYQHDANLSRSLTIPPTLRVVDTTLSTLGSTMLHSRAYDLLTPSGHRHYDRQSTSDGRGSWLTTRCRRVYHPAIGRGSPKLRVSQAQAIVPGVSAFQLLLLDAGSHLTSTWSIL